ncbi:MAG TPA: HupE/UreJ family protein [Bryobacteraceae bacterium]|nr:HupE/UreJ family protein [Bryobacteraceae bacterium]
MLLRHFAAIALASTAVFAHDIPNDVTVQVFLKPEGSRLHLLIRCPLNAIRDVNFPERGPGYLDIAQTEALMPDAATLWLGDFIKLYEGESRLSKPKVVATRLALESDRSFVTYEQAAAHVTGPMLPPDTNVVWNQTFLDVLFDYPIQSDRAEFSIDPVFGRLGLRVVTVLRYILPDGRIRAFEFQSDPGLVRLDPRWYQASFRFVEGGFFHILDGTDHLLFLFCLVIPFRKFRALIPIVTAFTVAHSITLIASAYNYAPDALWFPPLIETGIATSIVYMALENIVGTSNVHRRWIIAFGFGLVHGFGFSFALRETLQFAGSHMLTSLLSFNVGVELGQLLVLIVMIPALDLLFEYVVAERMGTIILSALVAHTGWHWMVERWSVFRQFRIEWTPAMVLRGLMLLVLFIGILWFWGADPLVRRRSPDRLADKEKNPDPAALL